MIKTSKWNDLVQLFFHVSGYICRYREDRTRFYPALWLSSNKRTKDKINPRECSYCLTVKFKKRGFMKRMRIWQSWYQNIKDLVKARVEKDGKMLSRSQTRDTQNCSEERKAVLGIVKVESEKRQEHRWKVLKPWENIVWEEYIYIYMYVYVLKEVLCLCCI